jgi:intein/homing endonuclease
MEENEWKKLYQLGLKGQHYESIGEVEKWVELYEYIIQRNWNGSHIYERLSIHYKKQRKFKDVDRIIRKYLEIYTIMLKSNNYPIESNNKYIKFKKRLDSIQKYL